MVTNPLVEFLGSYGPQPSSNNLYDEFVVATAEKTGCAPLEIEQPLVGELAAMLRSDRPRSVILTGTAGDGKTFTARKLVEMLGAPGERWASTQKIFDLEPQGGGRRIRIIKDLSELNETDKDGIFDEVRAAMTGGSAPLFVICVNDGHLLKFFRDREGTSRPLHDRIAEMLRNDRQDAPGDHFKLINMSRQAHQHLFDRIVNAVAHHPGWTGCNGCTKLTDSAAPCPIRCNLEILRQTGGASMRARLADMIRMAAADGRHLSIRQLILLTVNVLLGDRKPGKALLTCQRARNRADAEEYGATNPYANAFGENLNERERKQYGAFAVLGEFGVGHETNNFFDHSLLWGTDALPANDVYGSRIFSTHRERYSIDPGANAAAFRREMVDQRRRCFFSIDPAADEVMREPRRDPWNLSIFKHGAAWIRLADALSVEGGKAPLDIRRELVRGLNRMMTGEMTTTDDRLWLTTPSGVYLGSEVPLLVQQAGSRRHGATYVEFPTDVGTGRPPILRVVPLGREDMAVDLMLRPTLVECLLRIADGSLPASFSSECRQDVEWFQLRVTAAVRAAVGHSIPPPEQVEMAQGALTARPIQIMVDEEEW